MTRHTSIEAYEAIQENGLLGKRQWQFYDIIYRHGPITVAAACEILKKESSVNLSAFGPGPRFTELVRSGVIEEVEEVVDQNTKMKVLLYDVTGRLPVKLEKKQTKDQIIAELRAKIESLEKMLNGELF